MDLVVRPWWRKTTTGPTQPQEATQTVPQFNQVALPNEPGVEPEEKPRRRSMLKKLRGAFHTDFAERKNQHESLLARKGVWAIFQIIALVYTVTEQLIMVAFRYKDISTDRQCDVEWHHWLGFVSDTILFLDVCLRFFADLDASDAILADNLKPPKTSMQIVTSYLTGWFWFDIITAFPVHWGACLGPQIVCDPLFSQLWLLHVIRAGALPRYVQDLGGLRLPDALHPQLKRIATRITNSVGLNRDLLQILSMCIGVLLVFNVVACSLWIVKMEHPESLSDWLIRHELEDADTFTRYCSCLYLSVSTVLGYGSDFDPVSNLQKIHAVIVMCVGVLVFACIVTNILTAWESMNSHTTQKNTKMDMLSRYLADRGVKPELRAKVMAYYEYLFTNRYLSYEKVIFGELPVMLRRELCLDLFADIIKRITLFHSPHADKQFIASIVLKLKPLSALPQDMVIEEGQMGNDMFIIKKGRVAIWVAQMTKKICEKTDGDFFGEIACVTPQRRTATVVALEYTQLFSLSKDDLDVLLQEFPKMRAVLEEKAAANAAATAKSIADTSADKAAAEKASSLEADLPKQESPGHELADHPSSPQSGLSSCSTKKPPISPPRADINGNEVKLKAPRLSRNKVLPADDDDKDNMPSSQFVTSPLLKPIDLAAGVSGKSTATAPLPPLPNVPHTATDLPNLPAEPLHPDRDRDRDMASNASTHSDSSEKR
eukprot:CAMPEP_0114555904 /NCGR_PEP_ID=MMETSP0114-20121206/8997_1 /TAXON_ID=31324 /ORGANISM="Goniomonas sp, Strain m" /LENGTH=714 /DNA_ID=CAMNT_0001741059 /DNA_START=1 /DNA_END=2145 /DNA_ORIENTATION=+